MTELPSIPGTPAPGVTPPAEQARVNVAPAERVHIRPVGYGVERVPNPVTGGTDTFLNILVSPFKVYVIEMGEEEKKGIVRELTGGVVIP